MSPIMGPNDERYEVFYSNWVRVQEEQLDELRSALDSDIRAEELKRMIQKVLKHYENYYEAKDGAARQDVLKILQPSWRSPLEKAFMFIGGWRPTMVFNLAFAQAGQQIESELAEFLDGIDTPTMASLSSKQLMRMNDLQATTRKTEDDLEHRMAVLHQGIADQPLLALAQVEVGGDGDNSAGVDGAFDDKLKGLEDLLIDADKLRCETLKGMLDILTSVQAAQYLVAGAQIQVAIRKSGERRNGVS